MIPREGRASFHPDSNQANGGGYSMNVMDALVAARPVKKRVPGEVGIWLFILADTVVFTLFFVLLLLSRASDTVLYAESQAQLSQFFGMLNTVLLLTSSWCVAMAVHCARKQQLQRLRALLKLALLCGAAFGLVKLFEWGGKFQSGINVSTNDFFMYYFIFTGTHFLHLLMGMAVLGIVLSQLAAGQLDSGKMRNLEVGASFWHLVDLLWIVLFALFYLVK